MHTLRRLALGFASALTLAPALAGAARAGEVTYPQLSTQSTVLDTDLLAIWRGSGPLAKLNSSLFSQYVVNGLGKSTFLQIGNNLSDVANVATARSNLGLQSAAQQAIGTSGATLCLLNTNCTWSGTELFQAKITTGTPSAAGAMFNLAPGAAPTSPVNGDVWMTSSGEFERVNGATQQVAYTNSSISGNAATATALQNSQTISASGDVSCPGVGFNGTAGVSLTCTLANSGVGAATYGNGSGTAYPVVQFDAKGRAVGAYTQSISYPNQIPGGYQGELLSSNGSNGAQVTQRASGYFYTCSSGGCNWGGTTNISQFNRLGTGHYQIVFANSFPSTTYTFICTVGQWGQGNWYCEEDMNGRQSGSVEFYVTNPSISAQDGAASINVMVISNP